jgi:VWFA-related protein
VLLLAALVSLTPRSAGQQSVPGPGQEVTHKISVTTRLVEVSVVVDDKHGHPVTDLAEKDFRLFDQGHEQEIAHFKVMTGGATQRAPLNLPPGVYTNRLGQRGTVSDSWTIILLDRINTSFFDQSWVRPQIIKYLEQIKPQQRVALYTLGYNLTVVHEFTDDTSTLITAVRALGSKSPHQLQPIVGPDGQSATASFPMMQGETAPSAIELEMIQRLSDFLDLANKQQRVSVLDDRVRLTLRAFDAIARHISGLPGRKNLIWVSGSFPISFDSGIGKLPGIEARDYGEMIEQTTERLNGSNVAVYPVDARGLIPEDLGLTTSIIGLDGTSKSRREFAASTALPPSLDPNDIFTMNTIAQNTGGLAFFNSNDIRNSIERAVDDARFSYILGYYPDHNQWNGEFRKLKVKVDRPGMEVRTRSGYLAATSTPVDAKDYGSMLGQIAASPLESTGLTVFAKVNRSAVSSGSVDAFLNVDPRGIRFTQADGHWNGRVIAAFVQLDAKGAVLGNGVVEQTVNMNLSPKTYDELMHTTLKLEKKLSLDPKAAQLCLIALDENTGDAGSIHIPADKYRHN